MSLLKSLPNLYSFSYHVHINVKGQEYDNVRVKFKMKNFINVNLGAYLKIKDNMQVEREMIEIVISKSL